VHIRTLAHSLPPGPADYARTTHVHPLDIRDTMKGVDVKKVLMERPPVYESWSEEQKETFRHICGSPWQSELRTSFLTVSRTR